MPDGQRTGSALPATGAIAGPVIGIGVDTVDIERFRVSLARTPTMRERLFTDEELAYVAPKVDPVPSLAGRFAAREAVMKALGLGLGAFGFHEVWVRRAESGAPSLCVEGRAAELAAEAGVRRWHLSITHGQLVAVAMVVAEGGG
jgi:holo-[acyl-carrier protein] synthase